MPISLAPISRRRFLARSVAAGVGVSLSPGLLAADKPADPNFWALLSDIHLAADRKLLVRGVNMADHFSAVAREVLDLPKLPAALLINGDCAYSSGEPGDYAAVAEALQPLRAGQIPIHLSVGNHDEREHFWSAFPEEKSAKIPLADKQVSLVQTPCANWFILDSLEKTLSTPGLVGKEQLQWLAGALDAHSAKPALVLVHHNPGIEGGNMGLKDTLAFLEIIRPRNHVKAYIFGHTHHWHVEQDESGIQFINLPAVSYSFAEGEPTGWVKAQLESNGMRLELRCVDRAHKAHGKIVNLQWRA